MNLFFGCFGAEETFGRMQRAVEALYGTRVEMVSTAGGRIRCGYLRDGNLIGMHQTEDGFLVYLGAIQRPLPDWRSSSSPLDRPDDTAQHLYTQYELHGTDFLKGIHGQYAVAIGDGRERRLIVAGDPDGLRRLFHSDENSRTDLLFATVPAALTGGLDAQFDRSLEDFLLGYEFMPWQRSIYEGTVFARPGTVVACYEDRREVEEPAKLRPSAEPYRPLSDDERSEEKATQRLYEAFMQAVEDQCPTESRIAVLLGGFDSALVAAALHRLGKRVETFTFKYEGYPHNQQHTDTLARHLSIRHTDVVITEEVIRSGLSAYGLHFAQPMSQAHYVIQTQHALKVMRERGYLHAMSGDGCDGVFLGYPMVYRRAYVFAKLGVLPGPATHLGRAILGIPLIEDRLGHTARLARNAISVLGRRMPARGHITNRILDEISLKRLRLDGAPPNRVEPEEILDQLAVDKAQLDLYRLAFKGKAAVGTNRNRNEGSTATSGVTLLSPFQHPGLKQVASGIPQELLRPPGKRPGALGKYVLLRMAERSGLLPPEIIYQPKASPITAPVDYMYRGPLRTDVLRLIEDLPFPYDKRYVERLLQPKLAEELFRRYGTIGRYASHAASLLVTYASFARVARAGAHAQSR
jgi:asparagine synthetase B (glutamine-hydrolysing)